MAVSGNGAITALHQSSNELPRTVATISTSRVGFEVLVDVSRVWIYYGSLRSAATVIAGEER